MDTTMRELNQHTAQVLSRVETGESVTVTKNGAPIAVIRPYDDQETPVYAFRTDPMGRDENAPTFSSGDADFSERVDEYLTGFGVDDR